MAVDNEADPKGFVQKNGYNWTFASSPVDVYSVYKLQGVPTTLFIDRTGKLVETVVGGMEKADFEARLAKIL